ncbi:cytochrome P450 [Actinacidiphila acididurans]|uniref:Cytochrome P450 n=1 Tax=Actinacidiphila acididurans TaxID=2784346 RepID=A0ABS2U151_9ACTN|nr:cytochrome P450 [Actinacidiphila acididurans]MBM9509327.1 cytochrome P450 [Actinacidiphila acididurans]
MNDMVCPYLTNGLPKVRERPLDPPAIFGQLRAEEPIAPMTFPDGARGWVVTGYEQARTILADSRFSSKAAQKHLAFASDLATDFDLEKDLPPAQFEHMDPPEHTRYRKLLTAEFTVRRVKTMVPQIERIAAGRVAAMRAKGRSADLVKDFSVPMSAHVICELLGIPEEARARFEELSTQALSLDKKPEETKAVLDGLVGLIGEVAMGKLEQPGDDLLTRLIHGGQLEPAEILGVLLLLLVAGHETSANMLSLGTYTLLREPEQLAKLRADEALVENAVEELLRYLTIVHIGVQRTPTEDVELAGVTLKAGETALIHLPSVNRDPERFPDPDTLDVTRRAAGHLTFSHGIHQCLGQQLARQELRVGFTTLLREFPELRLDADPADIPMRDNMTIYGVHRLPVAW